MLLLAGLLGTSAVAAGQTLLETSNTYATPCTSAKAVHDVRCPNYTGFKTRLGLGAVAPVEPSASVRDALRSPEPSGLGLRIGRDIASGTASWYGPGFHGRLTASGERFDQNQLTAAHKTLPLGTHVAVYNPRTGKQVVVRINDRGPYIRGRLIDLSRAAAKALGMMSRGHDTVVLREVPAGDDVVASQ